MNLVGESVLQKPMTGMLSPDDKTIFSIDGIGATDSDDVLVSTSVDVVDGLYVVVVVVVSTVVSSVGVVVGRRVVVVTGRLVDLGWSRHLIFVLQDSICSASPN